MNRFYMCAAAAGLIGLGMCGVAASAPNGGKSHASKAHSSSSISEERHSGGAGRIDHRQASHDANRRLNRSEMSNGRQGRKAHTGKNGKNTGGRVGSRTSAQKGKVQSLGKSNKGKLSSRKLIAHKPIPGHDHHHHHHHHHHHDHDGGPKTFVVIGPTVITRTLDGETRSPILGEEEIQNNIGTSENSANVTTEEQGGTMERQTQRALRIENRTKETLTVYVQYRTQNDDGSFAWLPGDPDTADEALTFEIKPGEAYCLADGDDTLAASRVRLWAESPSRRWTDYQEEDLWLVPEEGDGGEHYYEAVDIDTFTFAFGS
jgi:hypothetical protein